MSLRFLLTKIFAAATAVVDPQSRSRTDVLRLARRSRVFILTLLKRCQY